MLNIEMASSSDKCCINSTMADLDSAQLPIEVIVHIMSYLSVSDRMSAGLVNRTWQAASLSTKFLDQQIVIIGRPKFDNLEQAWSVFQHTARPIFHISFKEVELKGTLPIWEHLAAAVRSLTLTSCDLSEKALVNILKRCDQLRALHIDACRECLMSGRLLDDENDVKELSGKFQCLQELSLAYNRYLSDALFNRLVAICPNLKSLNLMGCQISFHCGLYQKFYPNKDTTYASESVLTFLNVLRYIKQQAGKLKQLNFGYTLIDGSALATLSALQGLRLEALYLWSCEQLTITGIRGLTEHQTTLKVLDVSLCTRITDASLVCICKNLKNLQSLNIKRCRAVTDNGIKQIQQLVKLKQLDISECEQLTGNCITNGLCCNWYNSNESHIKPDISSENVSNRQIYKNENLEQLCANALNLDEKAIECIAACFPKLRLLDIGYCFSAVTDKTIQMIFRELLLLRILKISHCDKVSDAGLTGMGAGHKQCIQTTPIEDTPRFNEPKLRICLRSRAEAEIVRDANRKREVMKLCEDVSRPVDLNTFLGFSLIRLKGLRELNLSGCNRITDVSLKHAFAFIELRTLDLSKCQQITYIGLNYLTKNSPAIENLNLTQCYNVSDKGVSCIAQRLHRLKQLHLQGCTQLTDHTLDSIKIYCKNLQYLDVRHCQGMTICGIESLTNLCVKYTKQAEETMSIASIFRPPPPPLPIYR